MANPAAEDDVHTSWWRNTTEPHPFLLAQRTSPREHEGLPFRSVAIFPWTSESLNLLWDGTLYTLELESEWKNMIHDWSGAYAVGGASMVFILSSRGSIRPLRVRTPHNTGNVQCIAWALSQDAPLEPLVIFSCNKLIYVVNVKKRQITSYLRGHGGPITSIAVHPTHPYLFCTTARDYTTRIYDLTLTPTQKPNNPHWSQKNTPSLGSAAHGLQMSEPEGIGMGRCVAVLVGGRSGGHQAAVLCAAFHPVLPLIATGGLDRVVKIWPLPSLSGATLAREDKPLFSSSRIHNAGVLSVTWLNQDGLLTHSAPALMREHSDVRDRVYHEAGTVALWRWLGVDRFFPPNQPFQKVMRGCASDWQESSSFKIISEYTLPMGAKHLHVYPSTLTDPLILLPALNTIQLVNITHFTARIPPPFPEEQDVEELTKRMRLDDNTLEEEEEEIASIPAGAGSRQLPRALIGGWTIKSNSKEMSDPTSDLLVVCQMGMEGKMIIGVTEKGDICIWAAPEQS